MLRSRFVPQPTDFGEVLPFPFFRLFDLTFWVRLFEDMKLRICVGDAANRPCSST